MACPHEGLTIPNCIFERRPRYGSDGSATRCVRRALKDGFQKSVEVVEGSGQMSVIRLFFKESITQHFGNSDKWVHDLTSQNLSVARDCVKLRGERGHLFEYLEAESSLAAESWVATKS